MKQFDWRKNNNVGIHLMNFSSNEEYQRSAINRFYYSCFGPAKKYYEQAFRRILPSDNAHSILIEELINSPFFEEQQLGFKLKHLRRLRNRADYNSKSQSFSVKSSQKVVNEIFLIIDRLQNHPIRLMKNS